MLPGTDQAAADNQLISEGFAEQFAAREAACPPGGVRERLQLAAWAEAHGLKDQARKSYRAVLESDPSNMPARSSLARLDGGNAPTRGSKAYRETRALLPKRFIEYDTKRFVVMSDAEPQWTRTQMQRLERTHHQFHRYTRKLGLQPLPLEHKLVCVLFRDRRDYQVFANKHDDVVDPWIAGYYSPLHDRIVFYQGEANPSVIEARRKLKQMQEDIASIDRQVHLAARDGDREQARNLQQHKQRYRQHLQLESNRVDEFTDQVNTATTIHEATHQLMFHTRVQSPHMQYPLWLSEGLATAFETDAPNAAFGPAHEYSPRREAFEELLKEGTLVNLRPLVTWTRIPANDDETVRAVYHQSYALVTWMSRFRKNQLRRYLELMAAEPAGRPNAANHLVVFERAFGDVDRLQTAWLRHERALLAD